MLAGQGLQGRPSAPPSAAFEDEVPDVPCDVPVFTQPNPTKASVESDSSRACAEAQQSADAHKESKGKAVAKKTSARSKGGKSSGKGGRQGKSAQLEIVPDEVAPQAFAASKTLPDDIEAIVKEKKDTSSGGGQGAIEERVCKLIAESWKELKEHEENCKNGKNARNDENAENPSDGEGAAEEGGKQQSQKDGSRLRFWQRRTAQNGTKEEKAGKKDRKEGKGMSNAFDVPQTFKEMCALNAGMVGANLSYITIVEEGFERLVKAMVAGDHGRLELEANIMALRMSKDVQGNVVLSEFKTCMLASLRSLLPKSWSIDHERAWITMWDMVEEILARNMGLPATYAKAVERAIKDMSDEDKKSFGLNAFNRLFDKQPRAEDHFNTSNTRLSTLANNALDLCIEMYQDPTRTEQVVTSLGLRHIMYNISLEYFEPFVLSIVEEFREFVTDDVAVAGVEWVLTQIALIMINTVKEGSNPLLRAVINNKPKEVRKALQPLPRKDRFGACLGTVTQF